MVIYTDNKYLYNVSEVAEILQINKNGVYDLINKGLLKRLKLGRIKITKKSLVEFLENNDGKELDLKGGEAVEPDSD